MTSPAARLDVEDVLAAARRISPVVRRTPLLTSGCLPGILLKAEHLQHSGSFKIRGAANAILGSDAAEIITGSSGNHGIAVALLCRRLGVRATVVMAGGASQAKERVIRALGAQVVHVNGGLTERDRYARELARRFRAAYVPSSDHRLVIAGQGTVGLEVFTHAPDVEAIFVPVGGGGLLAGVCLAAANLARSVRVVGVEPATARRYGLSLASGRVVELPPPRTIADGLRAQRPGAIPFSIIRSHVDEMSEVTDEEVKRTMFLLHGSGIPAELSGSVAVAGALRAGYGGGVGQVVAVVSGGNGSGTLALQSTIV